MSKELIDNRMVKDNHQQGIERVKQRGEKQMGEPGKMHEMPASKAKWRRPDRANTPRSA